jgi:hypothetical protein
VLGGFAAVGSQVYAKQGTYHPIVTFVDSGSSIQASTTTIVVGRKPKG